MIGDKDTTAMGKNLAPPFVRSTLGNYPALAKAAATRILHAHLVEFPDLGHAPQIQAPEVFHKALRRAQDPYCEVPGGGRNCGHFGKQSIVSTYGRSQNLERVWNSSSSSALTAKRLLQRKFISTRHETASTAFNRDLDVNAGLLSGDGACINEPAVREVGRGPCLS
jgi:hypothetical protein